MKNIKLKDLMNEGTGTISQKFTKEQWEIIAHMVALGESDIRNKETKLNAHYILGTLQRKGIFGTIDME